jgi:hypothetical protein
MQVQATDRFTLFPGDRELIVWNLDRLSTGTSVANIEAQGGRTLQLNAPEIKLATGQQARISIGSNGNVGIGTTGPEQNLSVNSALNIDQANRNPGSVNPGLTFGSGSGEGIASNRRGGQNQFGLDFYTSSINRMSITNDGNVLIGTAGRDRRLDVRGDVQVSNIIKGVQVQATDRFTLFPGDRELIVWNLDRLSTGTSVANIEAQGGRTLQLNAPEIKLATSAQARVSIGSTGNVTVKDKLIIGPPGTPEEKLFVYGPARVTGNLGLGGYAPSNIPGWSGGGLIAWDIFAAGAGYTRGRWNTGGFDLAETFDKHEEALEPGDVVVADPSSSERLIKSTSPYQNTLLGVVATDPGFLMGVKWEDPTKGMPLGLAGRVPVKVNLEGGPIKIGDYLTSSSEPGYAMKASRPGRMIGIALEAFDGSNGRRGKIVHFINLCLQKDLPQSPLPVAESADVPSVYTGNTILDGNGEAWVQVPGWFEVLNKDFRYQLTCIGGFAPVYIAQKITGNRFKIAGGQPGLEVSWQVTSIRHDPYAKKHRIQVEEEKPAAEKGHYQDPGLYGQPATKSISRALQSR